MGFKVNNSNGSIEVDMKYKIIRVRLNEPTLENAYAFCHELGHAREKNPDVKRYKTNKLYRIRTEILAYMLGFKYVKKYNLPRIKYFIESFKHIKTYL